MTMNIDITELPPPALEFGDNGEFTDPRVGLYRAGPYSLRFNDAHTAHVRLGLVGPGTMMSMARTWFERCQKLLVTGKQDNPMYVDFPGFENAFQSALVLKKNWQLDITEQLATALSSNGIERFERVLSAYGSAVQVLTDKYKVDVVICCLPPEVTSTCRTVSRTLTPRERAKIAGRIRKDDSAQLSFDSIWGVEETTEDLLQRDFRRALKARVMPIQVPIQIATSSLFSDAQANQDPATRAWNSCVALFYKAGGLPWRLRQEGPETCFVGLSFHYLRTSQRSIVYSSLAQAFSTDGDGFALRGDAALPDSKTDRHPHLRADQAANLARQVLQEYRERTGRTPARIVMHKTTFFDPEERAGLNDAFKDVPIIEYVSLRQSDFRLVQRSAYPPKRGTLCSVNESKHYLFTTGFVKEWNTYPGVHVPVPVQILVDPTVDVIRTATEVLGLARMNWNTAFDTTGAPITLKFARQVGGIMAEVKGQPRPSYRYYM
jgi:hypothetical protein